MARANNGGWDFVKVGSTYQMKEDWAIYEAEIIEDNSTAEEYMFKIKPVKSTVDMGEGKVFNISHVKEPGGYWSGMMQIYETPEYRCEYKWPKDITISLNTEQ